MKIPNPNTNQPFERVQGNYGYRTVDGSEEVVHIPTNESNMNYYTPETVLDTRNCDHIFVILDMGLRELECEKCTWGLTFHIDQIEEIKDRMYVRIKKKKYPVTL